MRRTALALARLSTLSKTGLLRNWPEHAIVSHSSYLDITGYFTCRPRHLRYWVKSGIIANFVSKTSRVFVFEALKRRHKNSSNHVCCTRCLASCQAFCFRRKVNVGQVECCETLQRSHRSDHLAQHCAYRIGDMSQFRAKRLDLGGFINIKVIRDHTKRKVFEKFEPERCATSASCLYSF